VEVECAIAAAWVIHSPMAEVVYHLPGGAMVAVTLDLGRARAEPLICVACQRATRTAAICAHAHILCPACQHLTAEACAICSGAHVPVTAASAGPSGARRVAGRDAGGELRLEDLARLAPALWRACIGWLLEQQGYSLNVLTSGATEACWRGADFDGQL